MKLNSIWIANYKSSYEDWWMITTIDELYTFCSHTGIDNIHTLAVL